MLKKLYPSKHDLQSTRLNSAQVSEQGEARSNPSVYQQVLPSVAEIASSAYGLLAMTNEPTEEPLARLLCWFNHPKSNLQFPSIITA
jgi:hypothetical protein